MPKGFDREVLSLEQEMISWRRTMHAHPELSFEEVETTDFLARLLESFGGVEIARPTKTGLVASIHGTKAGAPAAVGIRADIDALPMPEETGLPYASGIPGVMHACGHDGHAAILLAAAKCLAESRKCFCGEVRLLFQHAEELPPGGAIEMKRAGADRGLDAMLALHLSSSFDTGVFGVKDGVLTAAVDRFDITVRGRGGHCAFPELCVDPVPAAAAVVTALQTVVSRKIKAAEPAVVSVCELHGGTAYNIIPNDVTLTAAVRTFSPETRALVEQEVRHIAEHTAAAFGAAAEVRWEAGYPSVTNDSKMTALAERTLLARFPADKLLHIGCIMPGEDYAYFIDDKPGFFAELGTRNIEKHTDAPHHSPQYRMDEDALKYGVQFFLDMTRALLDGTGTNLPRGASV